MKKILLPFLAILIAIGASGAPVKRLPAAANATARAAQSSISMSYALSSIYDDANYKVPNFYVVLSNSEEAKYNSNTGDVTAPAGSFTMTLDFFNDAPADGIYLPEGIYTVIEEGFGERPFGFTYEYSFLDYFDENGNRTSYKFEYPVEVKRDANGRYTITATLATNSGDIEITYNGPLTFRRATEKPTVYPQINRDVNVNLNKGGISFYQGVPDGYNQGMSYLNLYDVTFDESSGYMYGAGFNLCMMIAHKRFTKRESYEICPGTYTNATNLARFTWYPCREIDYMGVVMPFGSYIRELKIVNGERTYSYAYLKTGEFTIEDNGDGTYKGTLNAVTSLGYNVTATWSGSIVLNTENATFAATISDLTDDVDLDFSNLEFGRIYHTGLKGGCRTFIVDLGSPSGKDPGINEGGDLLRMEFLSDPKDHLLKPGLYTVVPRRWNEYELRAGGTYEPMSLNKGYFQNGDQVGTRYAHFRNGSYCVYDMVGPAETGTVRVDTQDYETYQFNIDLEDDAGFKITGSWDKPIVYCYDPQAVLDEISGIESIDGDEGSIRAIVEGSNLFVINAGNSPLEIYSIEGRLLLSTTADKMIPTSALGNGLFLIKVKNTTLKMIL